MTTDLATVDLADAPFTYRTLEAISKTEFVPDNLRGHPEKILAAVLFGREHGLGPMESLNGGVDIIQGKPSLATEKEVAKVLEAGHRILPKDVTSHAATAVGQRVEDGQVVMEWAFTYTMEMAQRAGLAGKGNWKTYPEQMLWWRAAKTVMRFMFADVIGGARHYSPDELGDEEWHAEVPEIEGDDEDCGCDYPDGLGQPCAQHAQEIYQVVPVVDAGIGGGDEPEGAPPGQAGEMTVSDREPSGPPSAEEQPCWVPLPLYDDDVDKQDNCMLPKGHDGPHRGQPLTGGVPPSSSGTQEPGGPPTPAPSSSPDGGVPSAGEPPGPALNADQEVALADAKRLLGERPRIADKVDRHKGWINDLGEALVLAGLAGHHDPETGRDGWDGEKARMMRVFWADTNQEGELDQSFGAGLGLLRKNTGALTAFEDRVAAWGQALVLRAES